MPPINGKAAVNKIGAINADIIKQIHANFYGAVRQTAGIAHNFNAGSITNSAKAIWDYLKQEITYKRDGEKYQDIRMPNRFVHDKQGDCKSYSLFAASILANLGYSVRFRYASYSSSATPTHVYVVANDDKGTEIIVDGVYNHFNKQKSYTHKYDYKMTVRTLSGIDDIQGIDGVGKLRLKKVLKKFGKGVKKVAKGAGKALKKIKPLKAIKKLALAPGRRAFRTLVALNARGLATKLNAAGDKALKKWKRLGGNPKELQKSINAGVKRKPLLGAKIKYKTVNGIGAFDWAAMAAAAAPIIAAFGAILKGIRIGKDGEQVDSASEEATGTGYDEILNDAAAAGGDTTFPAGAAVTDSDAGAGSGAGTPSTDDYEEEAEEENSEETKARKSKFEVSPALKTIGIAVLLFGVAKATKIIK